MGFLIGAQSPQRVLLGANEVAKIYFGAALAWEKPVPGVWTLYDNGADPDIAWEKNGFPRTGNTAYANPLLETKRLHIYIENASSSYAHNAHVRTEEPIIVPSTAAKMCVSANRGTNSGGTLCYGLLPANAANSYSVANGGVLSDETALETTEKTYSIELPDSVKGASLHAVINFKGKANSRKDAYIYKVWFE